MQVTQMTPGKPKLLRRPLTPSSSPPGGGSGCSPQFSDDTQRVDVLADSPVGPTARAKRANIESDTYPPSFKLSLALKDMRLVTEAAVGAGRDLKLAEASRAWLDEAAEAGAGDLDFSAVVATILGHHAHA